jgi:hypothetical protein
VSGSAIARLSYSDSRFVKDGGDGETPVATNRFVAESACLLRWIDRIAFPFGNESAIPSETHL